MRTIPIFHGKIGIILIFPIPIFHATPAPLALQFSRGNPYFEQTLGSGLPFWGQNCTGSLTKILDPPLDFVPVCRQLLGDKWRFDSSRFSSCDVTSGCLCVSFVSQEHARKRPILCCDTREDSALGLCLVSVWKSSVGFATGSDLKKEAKATGLLGSVQCCAFGNWVCRKICTKLFTSMVLGYAYLRVVMYGVVLVTRIDF